MATIADLLVEIGVDIDGLLKTEVAAKSVSKSLKGMGDKGAKVSTILSGIAGAGPALGPLVAGSASLAASLGAAGVAAGVFGAVVKTTIGDVTDNAKKVSDLTDKIELYQTELKYANEYGVDASKIQDSQAKAMLELRSRLEDLPPATRDATMAYIDMQSGWKGFVDDNKPATFSLLTTGYNIIGKAIKQLQPLYDIGAEAARRLLAAGTDVVNGNAIGKIAQVARPAMHSLVNIILNVGDALSGTFGKIGTKTGQGALNWIDQMTAKWAVWSNATDKDSGINKVIGYLEKQGPGTITLLASLATAAGHIVVAISPLAPVTAAIATSLAELIAAVPPDVLTAIVAAFIAWGIATKLYATYQFAAVVATKAWAVAQWLMNTALLASPITWIVLAVVALIAVIVLLATKTRFFQTVWSAVWGFLKMIGAWFAGPFANFFVAGYNLLLAGLGHLKSEFLSEITSVKNFFAGIGAWFAGPFAGFFVRAWHGAISALTNMKNGAVNIFNSVLNKAKSFVTWYIGIPGRLAGAFRNMFSPLWAGFKSNINRVIGAWNSLHFTIPSFSVLGHNFGGGSIGVPNIPYLAKGGVVTSPTLAMIGEAGPEAVVPLNRAPQIAGRDDRPIIVQVVPGGEREFRSWVKKSIRVQGAL